MRDKFKQENEAEIDFEVLQARTLRELEAFARNALYNVRVHRSCPVAASLAQQPKRSSLSGTLHETLLVVCLPTRDAPPRACLLSHTSITATQSVAIHSCASNSIHVL